MLKSVDPEIQLYRNTRSPYVPHTVNDSFFAVKISGKISCFDQSLTAVFGASEKILALVCLHKDLQNLCLYIPDLSLHPLARLSIIAPAFHLLVYV